MPGPSATGCPRQAVGYNDDSLAQDLNPPLTTVSIPAHELGRESVRLALAEVEGRRRARHRPGPHLLGTHTVIRESVGPARRPARRDRRHPRRGPGRGQGGEVRAPGRAGRSGAGGRRAGRARHRSGRPFTVLAFTVVDGTVTAIRPRQPTDHCPVCSANPEFGVNCSFVTLVPLGTSKTTQPRALSPAMSLTSDGMTGPAVMVST